MSDFLLNPFMTDYSVFAWGTKYSNPSTLPTAACGGVDIDANDVVIVKNTTYPYLSAYSWNNGFGTMFSDPSGNYLPSSSGTTQVVGRVKVSSDNNYVFVTHNVRHHCSAFSWDSTNGFGTRINSSISVGTASVVGYALAITPNVDAIAYLNSDSLILCAFTSGQFGTVYADGWGQTAPFNGVDGGVAFSPSGDALALGDFGGSNLLNAWAWNSSTGVGSKYTDPVGMTGNSSYGLSFSTAGDFIAYAESGSPSYAAYPWNSNSGFGTKVSPGTTTGDRGTSSAFTKNDSAIIIGPAVYAYVWQNNWGTRLTSPTGIVNTLVDVEVNSTNTFMVYTSTGSPFINAYPISFT